MLRKKFVYMTGIHSTGRGGLDYGMPKPDEGEEGTDGADGGEFNAETVPENILPPEMTNPHDRAKAKELIRGAYAAILSGDTSGFLGYMVQLRSLTFSYDVDYAEAVLEWFGDFEKAVNSIRASMQGFSTEKGDYSLTEIEYKALMKAKELLEMKGYSLDDVEGGDIVQKLLEGYEKGEPVEISKKDANRVLQFMTQMESKLVPTDKKQEVLAAELESVNKKRDALYDTTVPSMIRNSYGK